MNTLCEGCQRIFSATQDSFTHGREHEIGPFIPVQQWKDNFEAQSCHLCCILFYSTDWDGRLEQIEHLLKTGYENIPDFDIWKSGDRDRWIEFRFRRVDDGMEKSIQTKYTLIRKLDGGCVPYLLCICWLVELW
jgi:hypothetical protein